MARIALMLALLFPASCGLSAAAGKSPAAAPGRADMAEARKLLDAGSYSRALDAARRAVQASPEEAGPISLVAEILYASGDFGAAYEAADKALKLDPADETAKDILQLSKGRISGLAESRYARAGGAAGGSRRLLGFGTAAALTLGTLLAFLFFRPRCRAAPAATTRSTSPHDAALEQSYRIVRKIGSGGMGKVYEAVDLHLNRTVAIKRIREEIRDDARERERFLEEARLVAALKHPNIVAIHTLVVHDPDIYLVFEYINGHTVADHIYNSRRLEYGQALWVAHGTAAALEYAHSRKIVHRDLKPSNIMVDPEHNVKVMDFGIARQAKETFRGQSAALTVAGTPPYMSPEQESGITLPQSDIYALAVCFYEMVTGELPFKGLGGAMLLAKSHKQYVPPSRLDGGLPSGIDRVLDRALEPDPSKRCSTVGEFVSQLEQILPTSDREGRSL